MQEKLENSFFNKKIIYIFLYFLGACHGVRVIILGIQISVPKRVTIFTAIIPVIKRDLLPKNISSKLLTYFLSPNLKRCFLNNNRNIRVRLVTEFLTRGNKISLILPLKWIGHNFRKFLLNLKLAKQVIYKHCSSNSITQEKIIFRICNK